MIRETLAAIGLVLVCGAISAPAGWAASSGSAPATLTLDTSSRFDSKGAKLPGQFVISATLSTTGSKPLGDKELTFFQSSNLFGARDALLGTATTDATGHAMLAFQPAQTGPIQLKVRFAGDDQLAAGSATTSLSVTVASSPFKQQPLPLGSLAAGLTWGVCVIAVAVWLVLFGVLFRTTLGIRTSGRAVKGGRPVV